MNIFNRTDFCEMFWCWKRTTVGIYKKSNKKKWKKRIGMPQIDREREEKTKETVKYCEVIKLLYFDALQFNGLFISLKLKSTNERKKD